MLTRRRELKRGDFIIRKEFRRGISLLSFADHGMGIVGRKIHCIIRNVLQTMEVIGNPWVILCHIRSPKIEKDVIVVIPRVKGGHDTGFHFFSVEMLVDQ